MISSVSSVLSTEIHHSVKIVLTPQIAEYRIKAVSHTKGRIDTEHIARAHISQFPIHKTVRSAKMNAMNMEIVNGIAVHGTVATKT